MSIRKEIARAWQGKTLHLLEPEFSERDGERYLFMSNEVLSATQCAAGDDEFAELHAGMLATLENYAMGGHVLVGWDPRDKGASAMMARVDPISSLCWDFRCLDPEPGIRVLGFFAERDTFVACTWHYRDTLKTDDDWSKAIHGARRCWDRLLNVSPLRGSQLSDYITSRAEIC